MFESADGLRLVDVQNTTNGMLSPPHVELAWGGSMQELKPHVLRGGIGETYNGQARTLRA